MTDGARRDARLDAGVGTFPSIAAPVAGEVHLWSSELDLPGEVRRGLEKSLSPDEVERAQRFHFERDRNRFVVRRGLLRVLLGRYLEMPPRAIRFTYTDLGRPGLAGGSGTSGLQFNLSGSQGRAIYAVACEQSVGVDIERVRPIPEADRIAELYFSAVERESLRSLPPELQAIGFFNCWTAKEALLKARGYGLSYPLNSFAVTVLPSAPARLLSVAGDEHEAARWSLVRLEPGAGYVATVAVEGEELDLHHRPLLSHLMLDWDGPGA